MFTMGLASVESYNCIHSLIISSTANSGTPPVSFSQTQIISVVQEITNQLVCTETNVSDLTGVVANIAAINSFPDSFYNADDAFTNTDPYINSFKSLLASTGKHQDFWFGQG